MASRACSPIASSTDLMISISTVQFIPEHSASSPEPKLFESPLPPQAHMSIRPSTTHLTHGVSHPAPSVLSDFGCRDSRDLLAHPPGVIFGEGSFSAVSGHMSTAHVLRDQSQIPPANSRTDRGTPFHTPGSHIAIAGHQFGPAPNVLMGAQDFRSQGGNFRAGSFSVVAENAGEIIARHAHQKTIVLDAAGLFERSDSPGPVNIPAYLLVPFYYLQSMDHDNNSEAILDIEGRAASLEVEDEDVSEGNGILIVNRRRDAYTGPSVQGPNNSHPNVLFGAGEFVLTNTKIHAGAFSAVGGRQEICLRRAQPTQSQRTGNPSKLDSRGSMSFLFLIEMKMSRVLFKRIAILPFSLDLMVLYPKQSHQQVPFHIIRIISY
ncbi:hypothetical protein EV359DRAFT_86388 [Lentinula novae-zelandiae]|nr:hypothetical protein EV359DRAFT_86388 [Lentinula novae-zelandiae]